jgi:hypothetical protein
MYNVTFSKHLRAENTGTFTLIAKSNSMRRSAKNKHKAIETIEKELLDKLKVNCKT